MDTVNRFLSAFNEIEQYCKKSLNLSRYESFSTMINRLINTDAVIRRNQNDLLEFAELRNAIVHSRNGNEVIAYPVEKAVCELESIRDIVIHPPKIKSLFAKKVISLSVDEKLSALLNTFQKCDISQIPLIEDKKIVEIINGNTITRWLAKEDIVCPKEVSVKDLLTSIERKKNYTFLPDATDVYTCADKYASSLNKGWYFDAIFMTHNGVNGEGLTGIIVLEDIAPYLT